MLWLFIALSSYFLLAIGALVDRYLLGGLMPSPRVYAFYVGIFGIVTLFLIPFGFQVPAPAQISLALLTGIFHITGILFYYSGLKRFEASRLIPALGGFTPIFIFGFTYFFAGGQVLSVKEVSAFLLLILGSIVIAWEKSKNIPLESIFYSGSAAFFFALYFFFAKLVYLQQPFISGFIWTRIGVFLVALLLLFSKEVRDEIFKKQETFKIKTLGIFFSNGACNSGGLILQNVAIALAGIAYVAIISALAGIQYLFIFILALAISIKFPQILKEEVSRQVILQKIFAIFIITGGLAILALK